MALIFSLTPHAAARRPPSGSVGLLYIWLPAAVMVLCIMVESTHMLSSNHTSHFLRPLVESIFGAISQDHWEMINHLIRKTGHFTGYGLLAISFLRAWMLTFARRLKIPLRPWRWRSAWLALCCTSFVASCDEFHQSFLADRTGTIVDVGLDTLGATVFLLVVAAFCWSKENTPANEAVQESMIG